MADIFDEVRRWEENMNKMFEEIWGIHPRRIPMLLPSGERSLERYWGIARTPFIDIAETDKELVATVEMPGLNKEDININLTEDRLDISAESKLEEEKKEEGYIYKERKAGKYYRSISLPTTIDPENTKASYNNGVLEIKMLKTELKKKLPIKVE